MDILLVICLLFTNISLYHEAYVQQLYGTPLTYGYNIWGRLNNDYVTFCFHLLETLSFVGCVWRIYNLNFITTLSHFMDPHSFFNTHGNVVPQNVICMKIYKSKCDPLHRTPRSLPIPWLLFIFPYRGMTTSKNRSSHMNNHIVAGWALTWELYYCTMITTPKYKG